MNELGIKPEHECFDLGHVGTLAPLLDMGVLKPPLHVSCVMGVIGGIPPTARNLAAMADNIAGRRSHWGVIGISREQWMLVGAALDARRLDPRRPRGQLLPARRRDGALERRPRSPRRAQMTEDVGRRPATVAEARELLGVRAERSPA